MTVTIRDITPANLRQVVSLETAERDAYLITSNVLSIAEAKVYPHLVPQAVYAEEQVVGFAMYGRSPRDGRHYIYRLMIGVRHRGRGYGRAAVCALVERLGAIADCHDVYLSYVPENVVAARLYESLGFEKTGEVDEDGEIIMRLGLRAPADGA